MGRFRPEELARMHELGRTYLGVGPEQLAEITKTSKSEAEAKQKLGDLKKLAKKNYKRHALDLHPDRTGNDPAKSALFVELGRVLEAIEALEVVYRRAAPPPVTVRWTSNTSTTTTSGSAPWVKTWPTH